MEAIDKSALVAESQEGDLAMTNNLSQADPGYLNDSEFQPLPREAFVGRSPEEYDVYLREYEYELSAIETKSPDEEIDGINSLVTATNLSKVNEKTPLTKEERRDELLNKTADGILLKFPGRKDVYAEKRPGGGYRPARKGSKLRPLSQARIKRHLEDPNSITGLYVTPEGEDSSRLMAFDFDDHKGTLPPVVMKECVFKTTEVLKSLGLKYSVVRSSGGKGVHIFVTFEAPEKNWKLKALGGFALSNIVVHIDKEEIRFREGNDGGVEKGNVEVFPKNNKVGVGGFGNLLALPFGGKSVPLNSQGEPCYKENSEELLSQYEVNLAFVEAHQHNKAGIIDQIIADEKLQERQPAKKRTRGVQPTDTQIQVGNRNDTYFKMALKLFKKNLTLEEVTSILVDKNGEIEHPLEESEILSIVNSANTYIPETLGMSEEESIDLLNSEHAVVTVGGKTKVLRSTINSRTGETTHVYMDVNDFKNLFSNKFFVDSEGTEKSLAPFWLTHIDRRTAHGGVKFDPSNQCTPDQINTFVGYPILPKSGECGMFKKLVVDAICAGDEELAEYIWDWLAHMFQIPWQLPEVALVLMGDQGIGKNVFVEVLGKLVGYYIMLTDPEQLVGRFSGHLEGKLLIFLNEATWGGNKSALGKLKSLISDKNMPVERKGLDIVQAKNYARVIIASNAKYPVHLEQGDRRLVILNVSPLYKGNYEFFKNLQIELDDGGYEALMKELLENDLTYFNPRNKPTTGHEHALLAESSTPVLAWILHILTTETIGDQVQLETNTSTSISKDDFYSEYVNHCKQHRARPQNIGAFFKEVYQYTPISPGTRPRVGTSRVNMILIPALIDFIPAFEELTGMVVGDE